MKNLLEGSFFNPNLGNLSLDAVMNEMIRYIMEKPDKFYEIIVGCDSSSGEEPNFPLVVVILRKGEGGRFFLKRINYQDRRFYNWKERVLEEVMLSCQLALRLRENFEKKVFDAVESNIARQHLPYQFCYIHADVGENGATKDMIKEVTGLIRGNGFEPKIKPESYAASNVADRFS